MLKWLTGQKMMSLVKASDAEILSLPVDGRRWSRHLTAHTARTSKNRHTAHLQLLSKALTRYTSPNSKRKFQAKYDFSWAHRYSHYFQGSIPEQKESYKILKLSFLNCFLRIFSTPIPTVRCATNQQMLQKNKINSPHERPIILLHQIIKWH